MEKKRTAQGSDNIPVISAHWQNSPQHSVFCSLPLLLLTQLSFASGNKEAARHIVALAVWCWSTQLSRARETGQGSPQSTSPEQFSATRWSLGTCNAWCATKWRISNMFIQISCLPPVTIQYAWENLHLTNQHLNFKLNRCSSLEASPESPTKASALYNVLSWGYEPNLVAGGLRTPKTDRAHLEGSRVLSPRNPIRINIMEATKYSSKGALEERHQNKCCITFWSHTVHPKLDVLFLFSDHQLESKHRK